MSPREVKPHVPAAQQLLDGVVTLYAARDELARGIGREPDREDWQRIVLTMLSHIEAKYGKHDPRGLKDTLWNAFDSLNKLCRATDSLPD